MKETVISQLVRFLSRKIDQKAEELSSYPPLSERERLIVVFADYGGKDIQLSLYPDSSRDEIFVTNDGKPYGNVEQCLTEQLPTYDMALSAAAERIRREQRYS